MVNESLSVKKTASTLIANIRTDVAIVGAGLVGMAAAIALHEAGFSVLLIDSQTPKTTRDNWDTRIYAISPNNVAWLQKLGVWPYIDIARIAEMQTMLLMDDSESSALVLCAEDVNQDSLGIILESCNLGHALLQRILSLNIATMFNAPCNALNIDASSATLEVLDSIFKSTLLIAADGANSWVRKQMNISVQQKLYEQVAIVANFEVKNPPEQIARQWFTQDAHAKNSILAWLPLASVEDKHYISIVWSVSNQYAQELMQLTDSGFTHEVTLLGGDALGEMLLSTPRATFPLTLQKAEALYQVCAVLLGDAAHVIHPIAGQGMNLGFRDVIDLVKVITEKNSYQQLNDRNLLNQYMRSRKADLFNMQLLTDGLFQLFASQNSLIKKARQWGFAATKLQLIKKQLVALAIKQ